MATKKGTKKSASKTTKKSSKKSSKKGGITPSYLWPAVFPNACIQDCTRRYYQCLTAGVNPTICRRQLIDCINHCLGFPGP